MLNTYNNATGTIVDFLAGTSIKTVDCSCVLVVQDSFSELLAGDQSHNGDPVLNFPP